MAGTRSGHGHGLRSRHHGITAFAPQPFWLFWPGPERVYSHAPDFFARTIDGSGVVVDCRPEDRIKPRDSRAFAATRQACEQVGWGFRLITGHDQVWMDNIRWLAGYRHRRHFLEPVASDLLTVFSLLSSPYWTGRLRIEGNCYTAIPEFLREAGRRIGHPYPDKPQHDPLRYWAVNQWAEKPGREPGRIDW